MSRRFIIAPSAHKELTEIIDYIARDKPNRAISFIDELQKILRDTLMTLPNSGNRYKRGMRFLTLEGYAFIYKYVEDKDEIHLLHIYGPGQNWRV